MSTPLTWEEVRRRVSSGTERGMPARERLMPRDNKGHPARPVDAPEGVAPRLGAVLVLLYPHAGRLHVPLTVRTTSLRNHSGEVSLPGGGFDTVDGTLERTALREAEEELGVVRETVEVVATMTPVWIPVSNFRITPFVGFVPERPAFRLSRSEVAALIEAPLDTLADPAIVHTEVRDLRGRRLQVPYYAIGDYKVWGATALVLAQLVGRLEA